MQQFLLKISLLIFTFSAFMFNVVAQDYNERSGDWDVSLGISASYEPVSPGVDDYDTEILPLIDIVYQERYFFGGDGLGVYIYQQDQEGKELTVGIALDYEDGRDEGDFDEQAYKDLDDVDGTIEAKIFVEGEVGPLEFELELANAVSSKGHDGWRAQAGFSIGGSEGNFSYSIGPFINFASSDYHQSFYGLTTAQASATGFNDKKAYTPGSGVESIGLEIEGFYKLDRNWGVLAELEYQRLSGDAKDSPFTNEDSQTSARMGLIYKF